jgi:Tfp pilus assembly protein PilF
MAEMDTEQIIQRAQQLMQSGQVDEARELIRRVLIRRPNDVDAWRMMALLVDSPERAADCYEQVLRIDPYDDAARDALTRLRAGQQATDFTPLLRDALLLLQRDRREEAVELVEEILRRAPDHIEAWGVMARLVTTPERAAECLEQILRIDPENAAAQAQLARIREAAARSEEASRSTSSWLPLIILLIVLAGLIAAFILFVLPLLRPGGGAAPGATLPPTQRASRGAANQEVTCETLLASAMQQATACRQIQAGQACYGSGPLSAELAPEAADGFLTFGDTIPASGLRAVDAAPLSLDGESWGILMLALPATLPTLIPGAQVTLTVFGGARVVNDSGDLQSFTFSSALAPLTCDLIPYPGILVNADSRRGTSFRANGAEITALGVMYLRAQPGAAMTVSVMDGVGTIEVGGAAQEIGPGESVAVRLGGEGGLQAMGPPGAPVESDFALAGTSCQLLGVGCTRMSASESEPPTETPSPTLSPQAPGTPQPTEEGTAGPIAAPSPTSTASPTNTPGPTNTPPPTSAPPTNTPLPTATPSQTPTFTPTFTEVPAAFPVEPGGVITTGQPTFRWTQSGGITQYLLWVQEYGGSDFDQQWWGAAGCSGGECSTPSPWTLSPGNYHWQVMPAGGTMSITRDFTVSP